MALKMQVTTDHDIVLPDAYIRIDEQSGGKEVIALRVRTYANQNAASNKKQWLTESIYQFEPSVEDDAPNYHKQGYEFLKVLPEFSGAIDC